MQKTMRLRLPTLTGNSNISTRERAFQEKQLNGDAVRHTPPEKLFADLLKRQGRRIMADITECPPDTLPAHLGRLDDWREVSRHAIAHGLLPAADGRLSGGQLCNPATLADWLAAAEITRRDHRAPAFLNSRDSELAEIHRKIDLLAGMVASALPQTYEMPEAFCPSESEVACV